MTRSHIEEQISAELAARIGDDVHTEELLARATVRGRAMRHRRRAFAAAGTAAVVTVALGVASVVPALWRDGVAPPQAAATVTQVPAAPVLENRPARADEFGSNPLRLHWRFGPIPGLSVSKVTWSANLRDESAYLSIAGPDARTIGVMLSRRDPREGSPIHPGDEDEMYDKLSEEPVRVGGAPASLVRYGRNGEVLTTLLTWTVMPGVLGTVVSDNIPADTMRRVAEAVRTDRVSRCAVPFRLTQLPPEVAVGECRLSLSAAGGSANGALDIHSTGQAGGNVRVTPWRGDGDGPQRKNAHATPSPDESPASREDANRQVNGKPALWTNHSQSRPAGEDGGQLLLFAAEDLIIEFYLWGGYGEDEGLSMAAGYQPATGEDPATWPVDPLG